MKTDYIDIMQVHSPSYHDLVNGDGIEGLKKAQEQGKIRYVSLSADDDAAVQAVEMGEFDTLQISYNLLEFASRGKGRPVGKGAETTGP